MNLMPIDVDSKFALFSEQWSPKVIGKINNYLVKIGKLQGDFVWHKHEETDELFIVHKGMLQIDLREGQVFLTKGQMFIVPRGLEHKTSAESECEIIMLEPEDTLYAGDAENDKKVERLEWI